MTRDENLLEAIQAAEHGPAAFALPETRTSQILDGFVGFVGRTISWLWVVLVGVIVLNVILRYVFNLGLILFEELQWHIYAVGFMIGLSYAVVEDRHVRVDVLAERWQPRTRAWIEFFGLLLLLIPFAAIISYEAIGFAYTSWELNEVSIAPGGLGARWLLKSVIVIAMALLALAGFSRLTRVTAFLFGKPQPVTPAHR